MPPPTPKTKSFKFFYYLFAAVFLFLAFTPYPASFLSRLSLFYHCIKYQIYSTDLHPRTTPAPKTIAGKVFDPHVQPQPRATVRLVFIRHGESQWNIMANASNPIEQLTNIISSISTEIKTIFTRPHVVDSCFYDAKLTDDVGVEQAEELRHVWNSGLLKHLIFGDDSDKEDHKDFTLITSNLRRAIDTTRIGFLEEIKHT